MTTLYETQRTEARRLIGELRALAVTFAELLNNAGSIGTPFPPSPPDWLRELRNAHETMRHAVEDAMRRAQQKRHDG